MVNALWYQLFCREAARALLRHKTRSALATLGIAMGIAAVVLVVAVGQAGTERAEAALQSLGDNLIWLEAGSRNVAGTRTGTHGANSLMLEDALAIAREVPLITRISPQIDGSVRLIWGDHNWSTRFRGETPDYLEIKRYSLASGRAFTDEDVEQAASKVLIGQTVRQQVFGEHNPDGEMVRMQGQLFEVIGVLGAKGQSPDGRDQDDWVLLPYTTAHHKLRGPGPMWLDDVLCSAASPQAVTSAIDQIVGLMRQRHHIEPGAEDDFNIRRPDEVLKAQVEASDTLATLLLGVGLISLLVGAIGIMNVMLATVTQRTREIGVRIAVGAAPRVVLAQFLGEAVLLSLLGCVLGLALSIAGASGFEQVVGWPIAISPRAVSVAIASASFVGLCSGAYPARRAAGLDPVDALRHE